MSACDMRDSRSPGYRKSSSRLRRRLRRAELHAVTHGIDERFPRGGKKNEGWVMRPTVEYALAAACVVAGWLPSLMVLDQKHLDRMTSLEQLTL